MKANLLPVLWLLAGGPAALAAAPAQAHPPEARVPSELIGSAWYPEHCSDQQIEADLTLMQKAGLRMARVGEFAWSSLEPEEGHYTLGWLDHAISAAAAHGIYIVLGTPTDAPPLWLEQKYPEVMRVDAAGRRLPIGSGRPFSYADSKYRELCREIVERLALRFGHNPDVIGWQLGNEPTEDSYDPAAVRDFHAWLRAKYGTLASLNDHWMTWYWSHTYDSWDEIRLGAMQGVPGLQLDYMRFVTHEWVAFYRNQIDVIRRFADPGQFVTTNLGGLGWADRFNRHELTGEFDVAAWDDYMARQSITPPDQAPAYISLPHFDPWRNGAAHDLVRGWKQKNFWVMEMQPAFVDWAAVSSALAPGVVRDMIWQAIGHGAEGINFWQWRPGWGAVGQYHGSLVGPDTEPLPVYYEIRRAAGEVAQAEAALTGTTPRSEVAILYDYDSRWAIDFHLQSVRYDQVAILIGYYKALRERAQSVDIVDPSCDLGRYRLVVAPSLNIIPPELAARLETYVKNGGHLVLGPRSGMKNQYNALYHERQPGPLVGALGGRVDEYYALVDDQPVSGEWGDGRATIWAERLDALAPDAEVELRYGPGDGWLTGQPAAIERRVGRGTIAYIGAVLDPSLMGKVAARWADEAGVDPAPIAAPPGVEVCRRVGAGREVFVLINYKTSNQTVALPGPMDDVLHGGVVRAVELPPCDVDVVMRPARGR